MCITPKFRSTTIIKPQDIRWTSNKVGLEAKKHVFLKPLFQRIKCAYRSRTQNLLNILFSTHTLTHTHLQKNYPHKRIERFLLYCKSYTAKQQLFVSPKLLKENTLGTKKQLQGHLNTMINPFSLQTSNISLIKPVASPQLAVVHSIRTLVAYKYL